MNEQYPATDTEALASRTLDKRIAPAWLQQCFDERARLPKGPPNVGPIPGLEVYRAPQPDRFYAISADPAEGNPTSDDSALAVVDVEAGEEVAALAGKLQPAVFGACIDVVGRWYNWARVLVERNNHGHAVLLWMRDNSQLQLVAGLDGNPGWLSSSKGKALLYDACADTFREKRAVLHSYATFTQLASIDGATLRAPQGERDDRAIAHALALWEAEHSSVNEEMSYPIQFGPVPTPGGGVHQRWD